MFQSDLLSLLPQMKIIPEGKNNSNMPEHLKTITDRHKGFSYKSIINSWRRKKLDELRWTVSQEWL